MFSSLHDLCVLTNLGESNCILAAGNGDLRLAESVFTHLAKCRTVGLWDRAVRV